ITPEAKARVMAMVLSLFGFISGEPFLRPILDVEKERYAKIVKETLKFILIPAFSQLDEP
ncbi:MAG: hypothetical protein B5M56_10355, partial [Desulfococcus sp. 4484_241]